MGDEFTKDMTELAVGDKVVAVGSKRMNDPYEVTEVCWTDVPVSDRKAVGADRILAVVHLEGGRFWPRPHGPVTVRI